MDQPAPAPPRARAFVVLALAVVGISFAAPLVRMSSAGALVIAAWRLALSLIPIGVALVWTGEWRAFAAIGRRDLALSCGAGVLLALHFWSWNQSLRYTTVAASVTLVNTQPLIVAAIGATWLGERVGRAGWMGVALALVGACVVTLADAGGSTASDGDPAFGSRALLGDALAVVGAVTAALYYLIGRRVRRSLPLWPYVAVVYATACVTCVLAARGAGQPLFPQPPRELALFAGLALGPTLLGHTGMNWALGHLPALVVNLTTLGEPVGATLLAMVLPGIRETPSALVLAGGALILGGVVLAARQRAPADDGSR